MGNENIEIRLQLSNYGVKMGFIIVEYNFKTSFMQYTGASVKIKQIAITDSWKVR